MDSFENTENNDTNDDNIDNNEVAIDAIPVEDEFDDNITVAKTAAKTNTFLRELMDNHFIEYASYVIKDRAIPNVDDGLKPVQRRILWSLIRMDDGRFTKVANAIGHTMQFHPHGDMSIGAALVILANKDFFIEKQGNFGNLHTGDGASAPRYIECRLTKLAKETLFNNDITDFEESYDGRNKEPIVLPSKLPSLLMMGTEGIAVGMATKILSHNFKELLEAQIDILSKRPFKILPDFYQGGIMDASEYDDGLGKIRVRAKIRIEKRKIIVYEIPAGTTTESVINSIEKAHDKNKIKISSVNDYTTENVEIEVIPMRGHDPKTVMKALYAYTDCSVSISSNMMVIKDNMPVKMSVSEILLRNTAKLLELLRRELEIDLNKLLEKFHQKTLSQIFIENRVYKRIEECVSNEIIYQEVHKGIEPFRNLLKRDVNDEDVSKLLEIPIRRISRFDIDKNKKEINEILELIDKVIKNLANLRSYAKKYIKNIIKKYAINCERRTEIEEFVVVDKADVALDNIKVGWNKKDDFVGSSIKSDDPIICNEFDHLLCIERNGNYKVISIPDKLFTGKLCSFTKYDKDVEFGVIYSDRKTKKFYAKRTKISKFIKDKEYTLCPKNCKIEVLTTRSNSIYNCVIDIKSKDKQNITINLLEFPERTPKAGGKLIASKPVKKITFAGLADRAEIEEIEINVNEPEIEEIETVEENNENNDEKYQKTEIDYLIVDEISKAKEVSESYQQSAVSGQQEPVISNQLPVISEETVAEVAEPGNAEPQLGESIAEVAEPGNAEPQLGESIAEVAKPEIKEEVAEVAKPVKEKEFVLKKSKKYKKEKQQPNIEEEEEDDDQSDDWGIVQPEFGF